MWVPDLLKKHDKVCFRQVVWIVVMVGGFGGGWQDGKRETLSEIKLCVYSGRGIKGMEQKQARGGTALLVCQVLGT